VVAVIIRNEVTFLREGKQGGTARILSSLIAYRLLRAGVCFLIEKETALCLRQSLKVSLEQLTTTACTTGFDRKPLGKPGVVVINSQLREIFNHIFFHDKVELIYTNLFISIRRLIQSQSQIGTSSAKAL